MTGDSESDTYLLSRGWVESIRLNAQHDILKRRIGWTFHPKVAEYIRSNISTSSSGSPFRVADVAAGTGVVALELSSAHPSAHDTLSISALDITEIQFPNPVTIPNNVHFGLCDLFKQIPSEYTAVFDVVYVRLMTAALHGGGQETLLQNLRAMLKPGGYLQWTEGYPPFWGPVNLQTMQLDGEQTQFFSLADKYMKSYQTFAWAQKLEDLVKDGGFEEVEGLIPPVRREVLYEESLMLLWVANEVAKAAKLLVPESVRSDFDKSVTELEESVVNGQSLLAYCLKIVTARKPL